MLETNPFYLGHPITIEDKDAPPLCQELLTLTVLSGGGTVHFWPGFTDYRNGFPFHDTTTWSDGTGTATLLGNLKQINWALSNVKYIPVKYYTGSVTIEIKINQMGCGGGLDRDITSNVFLNILPTNDRPVINLRGHHDRAVHLSSIEDVPVTLTFDLHDVDAGTASMELNITCGNGQIRIQPPIPYAFMNFRHLTPTFISISGNQFDFRQHLLENLTFIPDEHYHGLATVTVSVSDLGNNGAGGPLGDAVTVVLNVNAAWDPFQLNISFPGCDEDAQDVPVTITFFDRDMPEEDKLINYLTCIVTVDHGQIKFGKSATTITHTTSGTQNVYALWGTYRWIERSLNGTTFTPDSDFNGNAPLTVSFSDYHSSPHIQASPLRNVTKTLQLAVSAVNDAPRMLGTDRTWHARVGEYLILTELSAYDVDANPLTDLIDVEINSTHGEVTLGWRPYWLAPPAFVDQSVLPGGTHKDNTVGFKFTTTMDGLNKILGSIHDDHRGLGYRNTQSLPSAIHYIDHKVAGVDYVTIKISDRGVSGAGGPQSATFAIKITAYVDQYPTCASFLQTHSQYCGCYFQVDHSNVTQEEWTTVPVTFPSTLFLKETRPVRYTQGCCNLYHTATSGSPPQLTRVAEMGLCSAPPNL